MSGGEGGVKFADYLLQLPMPSQATNHLNSYENCQTDSDSLIGPQIIGGFELGRISSTFLHIFGAVI
jgi:hypothetical protein